MPRCGRPARRPVSRPVCTNEKNQALSVDRKLLGTSKRASHPARPVPAVAPHSPRCSAVACRSAIGRPILLTNWNERRGGSWPSVRRAEFVRSCGELTPTQGHRESPRVCHGLPPIRRATYWAVPRLASAPLRSRWRRPGQSPSGPCRTSECRPTRTKCRPHRLVRPRRVHR